MREDFDGKERRLCYLPTKEEHEVDFVLIEEDNPALMLELKAQDKNLAEGLVFFYERYKITGIQLVGDLRMENHSGPLQIRRAFEWRENIHRGTDPDTGRARQ